MLRLSKDRKVTNAVSRCGKKAAIANTIGLPAGKNYSCRGGVTAACAKACYAGKLEKLFPSVGAMLKANWDYVRTANYTSLVIALDSLMIKFVKESRKHGAELIFRIHWDGDFASVDYAKAWAMIVRKYAHIQFWLYTRKAKYLSRFIGLPNVSIYYSVDSDNCKKATAAIAAGAKIALMGDTFEQAAEIARSLGLKSFVRCPELTGKIPLISPEGSACARCRVCVEGRNNVLFSISKK